MVVASGAPTGAWQIELDESADVYVATLKDAEHHELVLVVRLPRRGMDDVALQAAGITLEMQPDGAVAAYAQNAGLRTLAKAQLSELITAALAAHTLSPEEDPRAPQHLETELLRALEAVRRARGL
jgi:hypothetical protein